MEPLRWEKMAKDNDKYSYIIDHDEETFGIGCLHMFQRLLIVKIYGVLVSMMLGKLFIQLRATGRRRKFRQETKN